MVWLVLFFFFKQKTAYEMRISDWSSDVCSSDLAALIIAAWMVKSVFVIPMLDGSFVQFYFWVFLSGVLVCHVSATSPTPRGRQIGRASCRERVCQYV